MRVKVLSAAVGSSLLSCHLRRLLLTTLIAVSVTGAAHAQATGQVPSPPTPHAGRSEAPDDGRRAVVEQSLKHIYAVYLGLRSCSEIGAMQNDRSFLSEVSLEEARKYLRGVDAATREIGIDPAQVWNEEAPRGLVTAEALKTNPETHLKFCQRMGSLFRIDAGNLQANLGLMGAKSPIITKDY